MTDSKIEPIIEAALFVAGEPLSVERLLQLFPELERPSKEDIKAVLTRLTAHYAPRGIELIQVASGYRFQAKQEFVPWLQRLWERKAQRYSRAVLETLALILYRQPISRGEIEEIRGVAVSSQIMKTLTEREWVQIVGYRDVLGKPALYGSTQQFLDDFNLMSLADLPPLKGPTDLAQMEQQLGAQLEIQLNIEKSREQEQINTEDQ
jgi:segregation and condensation protein B